MPWLLIAIAYWSFGVVISVMLMDSDDLWEDALAESKRKHPELYKHSQPNMKSPVVRMFVHGLMAFIWPWTLLRRLIG